MEKEKIILRLKIFLEKQFPQEKWIQGYKHELSQLMYIGYQTALNDNMNQDLEGEVKID